MSPEGNGAARARPIRSVLELLRARIDHDEFDAALFSLEAVVADLGYGDLRPLIGSLAWIDRLREEGKSIGLVYRGESAQAALEIAGIADRFDVVGSGPASEATLRAALGDLGVAPERTVLVATTPEALTAARDAGFYLPIAVARGASSPEALRHGGAALVVADLQELLGPT